MLISPLNLISTPLPVLNSLGLRLRVGLSSDDPIVGRNPTEYYEAFLSIYSQEGLIQNRVHLGQIPPSRRKFFNVSNMTSNLIPSNDHLAVVHRIPSRLLPEISKIEEPIEFEQEPDYSMFRSVVEYSFPEGGNGSVIYETSTNLNMAPPERGTSNTITFTCQTILSDVSNTHVILIHYSMNPEYSQIAKYRYALHSPAGDLVASGHVDVAPFSIKVLDISAIIPKEEIAKHRDAQDGISSFSFVGYSEDAAFTVVVVNTTPSLRAVSVEHTHPPQTYLIPWDSKYPREAKTAAQKAWHSILFQGD